MKVLHVVSGFNHKAPVKISYEIMNGVNLKHASELNYIFESKTDSELINKKNGDRIKKLTFKGMLKSDIIHSHGLYADFLCFIFCFIFNKKQISTVHCNPNVEFGDGFIARVLVYLWVFILKRMTSTVFLSYSIKSQFNLDNSIVIYNGININYADDFKPNPLIIEKIRDFKKGRKAIFSFGVIRKIKGFEQLISVIEHEPLILIGDGPELIHLKQQVMDLKKSDNVLFLGNVSCPSKYISDEDLIVFPSKSEGFPLALLEVMKAGKRPLLSNIPVFIEIGTRIEADHYKLSDLTDLKSKINKLMMNNEVNSHFNNQVFKEEFTSEIMISSYLKLYFNMMS